MVLQRGGCYGVIVVIACQWVAMIARAQGCDAFFRSGMETPPYMPLTPSGGCGGAYPGRHDRIVPVLGLGTQTYYLFVPSGYHPLEPVPLLIAWHGAAGPGNAPLAADQVLTLWSEVANANGFIVAAQIATGQQGGWIPVHGEAIMDAILNDLSSAYNIDASRLFGWGFSAGGHVMHAVALQRSLQFAAYGVSAGVLAGYAGSSAPAQALRKIPLFISIGASDPLASYAQLDRQTFIDAGWSNASPLFYETFTGGHRIEAAQLQRYWALLGTQTVP